MSDNEYRVRTPLFPTYSDVRHLLSIWDGLPKADVRKMIQDIWDQTGTPQNPVDWSNPDEWIGERLSGRSAELAAQVWDRSDRQVNPRHTYGSYLFINSYRLLDPDAAGVYRLIDRGRAFLAPDARILRELDAAEGIDELLSILATKTRAMRGDLLPEWSDFLHESSKFGSPSTIKDTLRRRLANLVERKLVNRDGNYYIIAQEGIEYAASFERTGVGDPKRDVIRALSTYNQAQQDALRERLSTMPPPQFEHLVKDLLDAMGYEDVGVTKQSGDKGVDVVATVQFGITTVTEVVQVKRHKGSIGRPVLDQLRGALPYFKAIRGTIITLGTFTKGCQEVAVFPGAAPITLIDGERLIELLVKHQVGVQKKPAYLYELDDTLLKSDDAPEEVME